MKFPNKKHFLYYLTFAELLFNKLEGKTKQRGIPSIRTAIYLSQTLKNINCLGTFKKNILRTWILNP
jgi:hypothetical protein